MIKLTSFTALLLLLCFSDVLSRPIGLESTSRDAVIVKNDWWFHVGFHKPWQFAHPPLPAGGFKWPPHKKWPFAKGPMPASRKWPFVMPPFPCPWWPNIGFENHVELGTCRDGPRMGSQGGQTVTEVATAALTLKWGHVVSTISRDGLRILQTMGVQ